MEGRTHRQLKRPLRAPRLGDLNRPPDGLGMARYHHLGAAVDIGRGNELALGGFLTHLGNSLGREAHQGRHTADSGRDGLLHQPTTFADGPQGIGERQRSGCDQRGVLAQTMARYAHRPKIRLVLEHPQGGDTGRQDGRLGIGGQPQVVFRTREAQRRQFELHGFVRFAEDLGGNRELLCQRLPHPDRLGTLAGEEQRQPVAHLWCSSSF